MSHAAAGTLLRPARRARAPLRFIGAKRPLLREGHLPAASSPRRACMCNRYVTRNAGRGETVGFNALARSCSNSKDWGPGHRHFALLTGRPLKPKLHSKFGSDKSVRVRTPVPFKTWRSTLSEPQAGSVPICALWHNAINVDHAEAAEPALQHAGCAQLSPMGPGSSSLMPLPCLQWPAPRLRA